MRHYQRGIATTVILIIFLLAGVAIASGAFIFSQKQQKVNSVNSFEDCAKYYPVMESYPEQCNTPDGKHFVQELSKEEKKKLIPPQPGDSASLEAETNDFPIYPGSTYIRKDKNEPCQGIESGFSHCGTITYTWETKDDFDQVDGWYREDKSRSSWVCRGGAGQYGGSRSASGTTSCKKDQFNYGLTLKSDEENTKITLEIPY